MLGGRIDTERFYTSGSGLIYDEMRYRSISPRSVDDGGAQVLNVVLV